MTLRYNALEKPDPKKWLGASEAERLDAVMRHHREEPHEFPNEFAHATIHMVVENQAALGDETPVAAAIERLMGEGLDRHDAVHAVGAVLSKYLWSIMRGSGKPVDQDWSEEYFEEVQGMTVRKWYEEFGDGG